MPGARSTGRAMTPDRPVPHPGMAQDVVADPQIPPGEPPEREWHVVARGDRDGGAPVTDLRRLVAAGVAAVAIVLLIVSIGTASVSQFLAERDAIANGTQTADLLATAAIEPRLTPTLLAGDSTALDELDEVVDTRLGALGVIRLKIFTADGTVVYSDERRLVGQRFDLGAVERAVLDHGVTRAAVTTPEGRENEFEAFHGRLLEIRRPVHATTGQRLLLEVYGDYAQIEPRAAGLWRTFVALEVVGMVALLLLLAPVLWWLVRRLAEAQRRREEALRASVVASDAERRRLAGTLHDGPVQELTAASLTVAAAADSMRAAGQAQRAATVDEAGVLVRRGIASLRTLLVELYPPELRGADLDDVVDDLVEPLRSRGIAATAWVEPGVGARLGSEQVPLVHRVARECLRNAAAHSQAAHVSVRITRDPGHDDRVVVEIADDGKGFDVRETMRYPREGHVGLAVLADTCRRAGARLEVASAPGSGTVWRLTLTPEAGR